MLWGNLFDNAIIDAGASLVKDGKYRDIEVTDDELSVIVQDGGDYSVHIAYVDREIHDMECTCPYARAGIKCAHMAAACFMGQVHNQTMIVSADVDGSKKERVIVKEDPYAIKVDEKALNIALKADVNNMYCYALQQNGGIPLIKNVIITNMGNTPIEDVKLLIETDTELLQPYIKRIDFIDVGESEVLKKIDIVIQGNFLASVLETLICTLKITLVQDENVIIEKNIEISVLPYNQWLGTFRYSPDLLSAFVLPNHPVVKDIVKRASMYLKEWTGDDSIADYQDDSRERIVEIAKAIYTAIQERNISYITTPPGFEEGQKIRFPDEIVDNHNGNCMDMTLFYIACLETAGIHPIFVLLKDHIFSALWLTREGSFNGYITRDPALLTRGSAEGTHDILLVESTRMCMDKTFEEATEYAKGHLIDYSNFECAVDVYHTRLSGIKPLPIRMKNASGYYLKIENRDMSKLEGKNYIDIDAIDLSDINTQKIQMTKQLQWEHKLLDLSLKNILVNTRIKSVIPIMSTSVDRIEDSLADDIEYSVTTVLEEWLEHGISIDHLEYEDLSQLDQYTKLVEKDIENHVMHAFRNEKNLVKSFTQLYRAAKTNMEETGVNTLYITVGMLKWFEEQDIKLRKPHYAPIILIPIDLVRKSAVIGFTVRRRDDETIINITLLELLREVFGIDIPALNLPPTDEHGLDVRKIFAIIRQAVMNKKGWDIIECCSIGNYSFSQFMMWNDIHSHPEFLENNKIVKSLISGSVEWDTTIPDRMSRDIPYLAMPVDASQLRAINMAANKLSFILHGPPGTGKSQTITAMIANALAKGKTVLFVAEKAVAMEVVQKRLQSIGIGDFCLELHSHKATKKNVLDQLKRSVELSIWGMSTDYEEKVKELNEKKAELDQYATVLHTPLECGMSIRQVIDEYENIQDTGVRIKLSDESIERFCGSDMEVSRKLLESLLIAGDIIGNPSTHIFKFVEQTEYTQKLRMQLEDEIYEYRVAIEQLKEISPQIASVYQISVPKSYKEWLGALGIGKSLLEMRSTGKIQSEKFSESISRIKEAGMYEEACRMSENLKDSLGKMLQEERDITNMLIIDPDTSAPDWLEQKLDMCDLLENHTTELRNWINYKAAEKACLDAGLREICELYRNGLERDKVIPTFMKAVYRAIIWTTIDQNPVLNKFTGLSFNEKIRQYRELDEEFTALTREEIYYQLTHNLPTSHASTDKSKEMAILRKAIKSGGRGTTIRTLFEQAPHMIQKCCPCMMMSPMSVAQYLAPQNNLFDLVIFDEASQLPTAQAVGVIARGKDAVIVGDPNQMPPTSFFSGKYEDEENLDLEDQESILDDCIVIGMPNAHLQWHYRSRHESLIAFSNNNFYENNMLTFPSVNDRERRVNLIKVNGRKEKSRNEHEAKRIVEEVLRRYHDDELKMQSIGIITFNIAQQKYIEDLLDQERKKDRDFDTWVESGNEDQLFVKNLESVQGDERDVILFSVTFGPDKDGKLSLNFGPMNKDGGWRRLNVAVSRARQEMIVFSSMDSAMIDSKHPTSKGVLGVRNFLYYAETGRLPNEKDSSDTNESKEGIKDQICKAIKERGYDIKTDVGHSDFKIDIAVINPDNPEEYLLGVLLDGDSYHLAKNTRDREVAQESVLRSLGWELWRIWTMDWWDDKHREINNVLEQIEKQRTVKKSDQRKHVLPESEEIEYAPNERKTTNKKTDIYVPVSTDLSQERFTPEDPNYKLILELAKSMAEKEARENKEDVEHASDADN